ncbi:MAG TPA: 3-phosphoshikimate 1-carboxyvinyltransferase [Candidatus Baltobacteraceae bacterium]|nr:3-phosphoshikimate 1-carboxyvinyltransferase [Candidatus Baltobacteraceae bacterium]
MNASVARAIIPTRGFDLSLTLPGSKSITNRALLLAALGDGPGIIIERPLLSRDTQAFVAALNAMGARVRWEKEERVVVESPLPNARRGCRVHCHDAGTAGRFLPPAAVALGDEVYFDASAQLGARPMALLLDALRSQGASLEPAGADLLPFRIFADGLTGGEVRLDGRISSQFLSGLLMAGPLARHSLTIHCTDLISRPYVDLTLAMMKDFGRAVDRQGYEMFALNDRGRYVRREPYFVEADASTASYFFAAAAVTGSRLHVRNLRRLSLQGDIEFLDVLERMGASVTEHVDGGLIIQGPKQLRGVEADLSDMNDVLMTLACIAPFASGPTHIKNVAHARLKESDRIAAVAKELGSLGIRCNEHADSLTIHPGIPHPGSVRTYDDHRVAMAFSVLGLVAPGIEIENPACVEKTCPTFFDVWSNLEG